MRNIAIKTLHTNDELRQLISVFSLAFEAHYNVDDTSLIGMSENKQMVLLGTFVEDKIVGGLVVFEMTPIHGAKELYIYDIAIHPEHQKQGIGTKLIAHLKEEAKSRGVKTIFVKAESEDIGAVAFYRAIGGEEMAVNHFNFSL